MSTYSSYLMLTRDYSRTLNNLGKRAENVNAASYYQKNIGKVKSVDDLLKDTRLYTYVLKSAGLDDYINSKAFIKKVLTSDLADTKSFANQLTDKRFLELAKSFNFDTAGKVASVTDVQSDVQEQETIGLYNESIVAKEKTANAAITKYTAAIDQFTSVDELFTVANKDTFKFALSAFGLDTQGASATFYKDILTNGVDNTLPNPFAPENAALRQKLLQFAAAFNFAPSGTVAAGDAQSLTQKAATIDGYLKNSGASSQAAALTISSQNYRQVIGTIGSASELLGNPAALSFIITAYGFDPETLNGTDLLAALTSDLNDPNSAANTLGLSYQRVAEDFNFDSNGDIDAGQPIQSAQALERTVSGYLANANAPTLPDPREMARLRDTVNTAGWIENVDDLVVFLGGKSPDLGIFSDATAAVAARVVRQAFGFTGTTSQFSSEFLHDVFSSDLSDPASYANTLTDKRFAKLASLFNIDPSTGNVTSGGPVVSDQALYEFRQRYAAQGLSGSDANQRAKFGYLAELNHVRNVDDFLNEPATFGFALAAFGFDKDKSSKAYFRQVLTDPAFAAAQATALNNPNIAAFGAAFSFAADGTLANGVSAQSALAKDQTIERYFAANVPSSGPSNQRVASEYATKIQTILTVDDFIKDANSTTYDFALSAFGIDPTKTTKDQIKSVLTSDLNDPLTTSVAEKLGGAFLDLARAFNFGVYGRVPIGRATQSDSQLTKTIEGFLARQNVGSLAETTGAANAFKSAINGLQTLADASKITAVDVFLNNDSLFDFALQAYGLDPSVESKADIRKALTVDRTKSFTFLDQFGNDKYKALANALNFDPDGSVGTPRQAQSASDTVRLATKYAATYPTETRPAYAPDRLTTQETTIKAEQDYFASSIAKISTVDQLVADKRLTSYISKSFGYAAGSLNASDLKRALTSDVSDPRSFANTSKDLRYREIASAFNFGTDGLSKRVPEQAVQSSGASYLTFSSYLQSQLEVEEGNENSGVRLALYFKRKASTITSAYSILGDKALFEVVRTALGMSESAAKADIDVLARSITKKLNVADLKDPAKLEKFIQRFAAAYDVNNGGGVSTGNSSALTLITGGSSEVFSQDTLSQLQNIRARRF